MFSPRQTFWAAAAYIRSYRAVCALTHHCLPIYYTVFCCLKLPSQAFNEILIIIRISKRNYIRTKKANNLRRAAILFGFSARRLGRTSPHLFSLQEEEDRSRNYTRRATMVAPSIDVRASLKADCPRKDLFEAVQTVGHAVSGRSSLPILSHILIQAEDNGLRLVATDLELGISCRIPARIEESGALTAPARTLTEVLANLPDKGDVALSVDKSHTVRVHCERSDYKILGLPAEEYPKLPEVKDTASFSLPQALLKEMIRHTYFAVSTDEARAILTGILMVFDGETLKFVATDTHRLAVMTSLIKEGRGSQNAIVPARALNELTRLLTDADRK